MSMKKDQTLADTISEVEKLQAVQQLTATLLPSSTVNVMSNKEEQCFHCQQLGHITRHCPNVCCFECDEYGHIAADCRDRIPPSGMPACHKRQHSLTQGIMPDQLLDTTTRTGTDIAGQDHSHTLADIEVTIAIIHTEAIPDHITDVTTGSTSWHHHSSTYCYCHDISHQRSSSHRSSSTHSRDCSRSSSPTSYKSSKNTSSKSSSSYSRTTVKPQDKKQRRVRIDNLQSDYYSSDNTSSDSEDDLN